MCGRFVQIDSTVSRTKLLLGIQSDLDTYPPHKYRLESFNIAPGRPALVVTTTNNRTDIEEMGWGITPRWSNEYHKRIINARSESLYDKPTFKDLLGNRVLIPVEGFYEWREQRGPKAKTKQPYFFYRRDGEPLFLAGVYERLINSQDGEITKNFVVLTTRANEMMLQFHHRMPVIIEPDEINIWLDDVLHQSKYLEVASPKPNKTLKAHPVSSRVNSTGNDGPDLIEDLNITKEHGKTDSLFD